MSPSAASLFAASYRVVSHEHVDEEFAKVTVRCIGYPSHGTHPVDWSFALNVPKVELANWPLGSMVRLTVTNT